MAQVQGYAPCQTVLETISCLADTRIGGGC